MAYKNLINVSCASTAEVFRHVKDWLGSRNGIANYSTTGLGWTLHDSYFATNADSVAINDWVVLSSSGEDGKRGLYYRILFASLANSILQTRGGLYWNAATDAWVSALATADQANGPTTGSTFSLYIYGDLNAFTIIIGDGSAWFARHFGAAAETLYSDTPVLTTSSVTAGSSVSVPVGTVPATWAVGQAVIIRDNAAIERTTIISKTGSAITVNLANSYASGAMVAADYSVLCTNGNFSLTNFHTQIGRGGAVAPTATVNARLQTDLLNDPDPDQLNSAYYTQPVRISLGTGTNVIGYYGQLRNILVVSSTGITAGSTHTDDTGATWRAFPIGSYTYLFKEV